MNANDIDDLLSKPAHNPETMTLQVLAQIRDNLAAINRKQDVIGSKVDDAATRVARLEERSERVERIEKLVEKLETRVGSLLDDKAQRDGASTVFVGIRGWTPVVIAILSAIASIFTALYLSGRAAGVVSAPPGYIAPAPQHPSVERR